MQTGDIIRIRSTRYARLITHEGILVRSSTGDWSVLDITLRSVHPRQVPLHDFLTDHSEFISIRSSSLSGTDPDVLRAKFAMLASRRTYNALTYNCEHFIDEMTAQVQHSEQVEGWMLAASLLVLAVLVAVAGGMILR